MTARRSPVGKASGTAMGFRTISKAPSDKFVPSASASNRGSPVHATTRTIRSVRVRNAGALLSIEFEADGFLYKMVRLMIGALIDLGLGKAPADEIQSRLHHPRPQFSRARHVAPAT